MYFIFFLNFYLLPVYQLIDLQFQFVTVDVKITRIGGRWHLAVGHSGAKMLH